MVRWPDVVQPRTELNDVFSAEDWVPTLVAAAGTPDIKGKLLEGYNAGGTTFKVHLDGYDQRDFLSANGADKRREFFYWTDDGNLAGLRFDQYKVVFMEQQAHGLEVWMQPLVPLRAPKVFNLRSDPFERGPTSILYGDWTAHRMFLQVPMQVFAAKWLASFKEFPPRQKPASFNLDEVMRKMSEPGGKD